MIKTKQEYLEYLEADRIALGITTNWKLNLKWLLFPNPIYKFQKNLRKLEYYRNCRRDFFGKIYYYYLRYWFKKESMKLGFSIPLNVFGSGLAIVHYGTIVVNSNARIGRNCRIQVCTNIGASGGSYKAPILGDNVYIGPGSKIYGDIKIANNIAISANSVVNKSFLEENIMIAGCPAKKIKEIDISKLISTAK